MTDSRERREPPCPICGNTMQVEKVHRSEVDVCDEHGVWLDAGELEKICRRVQIKGWRTRKGSIREARRQGRVAKTPELSPVPLL